MENFKNLSHTERRLLVRQNVEACTALAKKHIAEWKPLNPAWPVIEGCAYLRLSTAEQVSVEKGSLEQQINMALEESKTRSSNEKTNFRIVAFFIEPGITGRIDNRPAFQAMLRGIKQGRFKFAFFKEIARVARDAGIWKKFFKLCIDFECELFIRGFPFNPNDPTQILQLDFLAMLAEYESNLTSKRLKESVHSAMLSSGKFNSTRPILGLDQLVESGHKKVGFYVPNDDELKAVEWIMRTFVRYRSYSKTLQICQKHGVKNKYDIPFSRNSLISLLKNKRYIGEWELNVKSKSKNPLKLMPYERHENIKLPHGCVVDKDLWQRVQGIVEQLASARGKNTKIRRVYVLHGILRAKDNSPFHGTGAWGRMSQRNYYYNKTLKIRLGATELETAAKNAMKQIIAESPDFRKAIQRRTSQAEINTKIFNEKERDLLVEIQEVERRKETLNRRLDFLLDTEDHIAAGEFKEEFRNECTRLNDDLARLRNEVSQVQQQKATLKDGGYSWKDLVARAVSVQEIMQEHDAVALKAIYKELFEAIIVGDLEEDGTRDLSFILKDGSSPTAFVTVEEKTSVGQRMVGPPGLEPGTTPL